MLVQDEPTSHLDMQSIEALQTCLKGYTGGIVLVTHDQHFCNSVAEKVPSPPSVYRKKSVCFRYCLLSQNIQKCRYHTDTQQVGDDKRLSHEQTVLPQQRDNYFPEI